MFFKKRKTLTRLTRFMLCSYVMIYCMSFTVCASEHPIADMMVGGVVLKGAPSGGMTPKRGEDESDEEEELFFRSPVVNAITIDKVFNASNGYRLSDKIKAEVTLDFQGPIDVEHDLVIDKPVNIISSTSDAVINLHTNASEGSVLEEYYNLTEKNSFIIEQNASRTNITGIMFNNTVLSLNNCSDTALDDCNISFKDLRIKGGLKVYDAENVTIKNSNLISEDNTYERVIELVRMKDVSDVMMNNNTFWGDDGVSHLLFHEVSTLNGEGEEKDSNVTLADSVFNASLGCIESGCDHYNLINNTIMSEIKIGGADCVLEDNLITAAASVTGKNANVTGNLFEGSAKFAGRSKLGMSVVSDNAFEGNVTIQSENVTFTDNDFLECIALTGNAAGNYITDNVMFGSFGKTFVGNSDYVVTLAKNTRNNTISYNKLAAEFIHDLGKDNTIEFNSFQPFVPANDLVYDGHSQKLMIPLNETLNVVYKFALRNEGEDGPSDEDGYTVTDIDSLQATEPGNYRVFYKSFRLNESKPVSRWDITEGSVPVKIGLRPITITPKFQTIGVGGQVQTEPADEVVSADNLVEGHKVTSVTAEPAYTDWAGSNITIGFQNATIEDADGENVTQKYNITYGWGGATVIRGNITENDIMAPVAIENLTCNGKQQALATAGSVNKTGAVMLYSLSKSGPFTEDVPTAKDEGNYTVWYMIDGGDNYNNISAKSIGPVVIGPGTGSAGNSSSAINGTTKYGSREWKSKTKYQLTRLQKRKHKKKGYPENRDSKERYRTPKK